MYNRAGIKLLRTKLFMGYDFLPPKVTKNHVSFPSLIIEYKICVLVLIINI